MKQLIKASVVNFAQEDLEAMIAQDTMDRILKEDSSPVFKAYVVAEEGDANAVLLGAGRKVFKYVREAVSKVDEALRYGVAAFYRHEGNDGSGDNSHRQKIGELVGHTLREIDGKTQAVAVFYLYPGDHRDKDLWAASIESNIAYAVDGEDVRVRSVDAVTGIALSDVDEPAFPGATLVAAMQAFADDPNKDMTDPGNNDLIVVPDTRDLKDFEQQDKEDQEKKEEEARAANDLLPGGAQVYAQGDMRDPKQNGLIA